MELNKDYWETKWHNRETGWDIGHTSTPIKSYVDQLTNKELKILIPGSGNSYEGEYLYRKGFKNVNLLDFSEIPFKNLLERCPDFPKENLINQNFFEHEGKYDLILEQTFFSAIHPSRRHEYIQKNHDLLKDGGNLVGLLFNVDFNNPHPPYGGNKAVYEAIFMPLFELKIMEEAHNSIDPRKGNELFFIAIKKN
jgi:SAM-dependent methyltransferase